jgi:hypothetical protein
VAARSFLVANELTAANQSALIDGVLDLVIETPTRTLAQQAVQCMLGAIANPAAFSAAQVVLPFQLYGPENV